MHKMGWMAAVLSLWLVAGCSRDEAPSPQAAPAAAPATVPTEQPAASSAPATATASASDESRVQIDTDQGLFWFQPRLCTVGLDADSGAVSYNIEGAGQSPDGLPVYVTVEDEDSDPAHSPELRINVGTDQPRKTPEVVWTANEAAAASLQVPATRVLVEGKRVTLEGVVFTRSGTDRLVVRAPIRVDCTQPPGR